MNENVHFIAIGGAVMHNLALALHNTGHNVTGSDDDIFEPSRSRLDAKGLLPEEMGWHPERITEDLDYVILGMHAKIDNPELLKAQELGLKVLSFPEFIYEKSKNKKRVVIAGSHGKTSMTSMVMHVLHNLNLDFDYLVGAQIEGFETMVQISDAPWIIIEGDEYLTSPLDRRSKFFHYHHDLLVISGIAWDHINVFPVFEDYRMQFEKLTLMTPENGKCFYYDGDELLEAIGEKVRPEINAEPYGIHPHKVINGETILLTDSGEYKMQIFGEHNMANLSAAKNICTELGISDADFYSAMSEFKGAARRLEIIDSNDEATVFRDFAHSPSKLKATCKAVKDQYKDRKLVACLELHTFSSLNKDFLSEYENTFSADYAAVFFNPDTVAKKGLEQITGEDIKAGFNQDIEVFSDKNELESWLRNHPLNKTNLLLMSSGNFGGIDLQVLTSDLLSK